MCLDATTWFDEHKYRLQEDGLFFRDFTCIYGYTSTQFMAIYEILKFDNSSEVKNMNSGGDIPLPQASLWYTVIMGLVRKASCSQMFFKIVVPKNFEIFTGKHLCCSLFLINLRTFTWSATLLKTDFNTGAFW